MVTFFPKVNASLLLLVHLLVWWGSWCLQDCGTCDLMQEKDFWELYKTMRCSEKDERRGKGAWGVLGGSSGNYLGWNNLTLPSPPLCHISNHNTYMLFETPPECQLSHFPREFVPVLDNPSSEGLFLYVQTKPSLLQF